MKEYYLLVGLEFQAKFFKSRRFKKHVVFFCFIPIGSVQQSINRKQSWKGSKESLVPQRHGPPLGESVAYRSESPNSQTDVGRPLSGSGITAFTQAHPSNGQRVNPPPPPQVRSVTPPPPPRGQTPPPRGTTPPPPSWEPNSQTKR